MAPPKLHGGVGGAEDFGVGAAEDAPFEVSGESEGAPPVTADRAAQPALRQAALGGAAKGVLGTIELEVEDNLPVPLLPGGGENGTHGSGTVLVLGGHEGAL